jgi:hypothetical protein
MLLRLVGNYPAPQTIRPSPALVDLSTLANSSPGNISRNIFLGPAVDGDGSRAIVPFAIRDNGSRSGGDGTFTVSLESPAQVGIIRVWSKVGTGIAEGKVGPRFAGIDNDTIRSARDRDRNCVAFLVNDGIIVRLGATIAYFLEIAEVR